MSTLQQQKLDRSLGPWMLWGLGVGYVISGMYFGWNLGLPLGGTLGLAVATAFITLMYVCFTFSYTELACAIPRSGGAFQYADRALGRTWGFVGGVAQLVEFLFAPPAIAAAIGAYFHIFFPQFPVLTIAISAYALFTIINILGVKLAASFELLITALAVVELLIFAGIAFPSFEFSNLAINPLPNGWSGVFASIPFAIWFFLAIEGLANVAEETKHPEKNLVRGFATSIATLVALCVLVYTSAIGVAGWDAIVYPTQGAAASDSPLPLALGKIVGTNHVMYHLLISIGLLGLIASFHGIILAAGRCTLEFGRVRYLPTAVGVVHPKFKTPAKALLVNMVVGVVAILTGKTAEIITIACFGALTLYIISMISLFVLRKNEPHLSRPFRVPLYPVLPAVALIIASVSIVAMAYYNPVIFGIYLGILVLAVVCFKMFVTNEETWRENERKIIG